VLRPPTIAPATPAAARHDSAAATAPDSSQTIDTMFDVNATLHAATGPTAARGPVAVDPALFPSRGIPQNPGADAPGYIRVLAHGGTARVRVDGRTLGFSPLVVRVDPGPHVVSLESSGDAFLPAQITVNAMPNDTAVAVFAARLSQGPEQDSGTTPGAATPSATPSAAPGAASGATAGSASGAPRAPSGQGAALPGASARPSPPIAPEPTATSLPQ
jgi:hypothetical protein